MTQAFLQGRHRSFLALLASLAFALATPALGASDSPHLAQHRKLTGDFTAMLAADPAGAMKFATAAVESTKLLGPFDPKRGDALEMLCRAHMGAEEWTTALPLATEVVTIRRAERPLEPELLSLALLNQAVVLFGAGRQDEADAALTELVQVWRQAFGPKDLRRAEKLEQYATLVQGGFGRTAWVTELLREALAIRELHPPDSHLAITLYDLAVQEMLQQQPGAADAHLARAAPLFEKELARRRQRGYAGQANPGAGGPRRHRGFAGQPGTGRQIDRSRAGPTLQESRGAGRNGHSRGHRTQRSDAAQRRSRCSHRCPVGCR